MSAFDKLNMNPYTPPCQSGCQTESTQFANLCVPVTVSPKVTVGTADVECCGDPVVCCRGESACSACELTVTQRIRIRIPIRFNAEVSSGDADIDCGCGCDCDQ